MQTMKKSFYKEVSKQLFGEFRVVGAYFVFFFFLLLIVFCLIIPFDWFLWLGWSSSSALFSVYELVFFGFRIGILIDKFSLLLIVLELIIFPLVLLLIERESKLTAKTESQYLIGLSLILLSITLVFLCR